MAHDREKYEKQDKSTNDVRKTWRYMFIQLSVLFLMLHMRRRILYVFVVWLSTHLRDPGTIYKLTASVTITELLQLLMLSIDSCSGVGNLTCDLLVGNKGW